MLAVDDFALRHGHRYGTLVVDAETRPPIELWDTRMAEPLAVWLAAHPGVEAVCRDGSQVYRCAISTGAPDAVQVSDRLHLWQGLGRKVRETVAVHRACLAPPAAEDEAIPDPDGPAAQRARITHAAVHALLGQGIGIRAAARRLGTDRNVVRRFARAATWQQAAPTWPKLPGILGPYRTYLQLRWEDGEHNIAAPHREATARGFGGSEATVRLYLTTLRHDLGTGASPPPTVPSVFQVTRLITTRPESLDEDRRAALKQLLARC